MVFTVSSLLIGSCLYNFIIRCKKDIEYLKQILYTKFVTARTNASEPKLERMLYYEDTKLRSRRRSREGHVYIHSAKIPLTRAPVSVVNNSATISCRGGVLAPLQILIILIQPLSVANYILAILGLMAWQLYTYILMYWLIRKYT